MPLCILTNLCITIVGSLLHVSQFSTQNCTSQRVSVDVFLVRRSEWLSLSQSLGFGQLLQYDKQTLRQTDTDTHALGQIYGCTQVRTNCFPLMASDRLIEKALLTKGETIGPKMMLTSGCKCSNLCMEFSDVR